MYNLKQWLTQIFMAGNKVICSKPGQSVKVYMSSGNSFLQIFYNN